MPFSACGKLDCSRTGRTMVCGYLAAHDCGKREGGDERNTDVGPARRSSAAATLACMATARLTARRHEKAQTRRSIWAENMVLPKGGGGQRVSAPAMLRRTLCYRVPRP